MCGYCGAVPLFRPREVYLPSGGADMSAAVQPEHAMGARVAALAAHAHAGPPVTANTAAAVAFTAPRRHRGSHLVPSPRPSLGDGRRGGNVTKRGAPGTRGSLPDAVRAAGESGARRTGRDEDRAAGRSLFAGKRGRAGFGLGR